MPSVFTLLALSDRMRAEKGVKEMTEKKMLDKISIYIPQKKMEERRGNLRIFVPGREEITLLTC
jgi:hypothetical protein